MRELYGIYQRSLGESDDFQKRVIPLTLRDAKYSSWEDRKACAEYWRHEYERMQKSIADLGEHDLALYRAIKAWHNAVGDMLAYVNDILQPRDLEQIIKGNLEDLRTMLRVRVSADGMHAWRGSSLTTGLALGSHPS